MPWDWRTAINEGQQAADAISTTAGLSQRVLPESNASGPGTQPTEWQVIKLLLLDVFKGR
jgi:hypothetical protein